MPRPPRAAPEKVWGIDPALWRGTHDPSITEHAAGRFFVAWIRYKLRVEHLPKEFVMVLKHSKGGAPYLSPPYSKEELRDRKNSLQPSYHCCPGLASWPAKDAARIGRATAGNTSPRERAALRRSIRPGPSPMILRAF